MRRYRLAYSPCPNDTYLFSAIASGELGLPDTRFDIELLDIAELNRAAQAQTFDIIKVSFSTWLQIREHYQLLDTGAALGFGCGPLLLSGQPRDLQDLGNCRIAFPGATTTAYLLFRLLGLQTGEHGFVRYDEVIPRVASGEYDCGVIIHESRFTYADAGLHCLLDLGHWWETQTGLPIPLGGFVMHRRFGERERMAVEALMRLSMRKAAARPVLENGYIRAHAQEMDPQVLQQHIDLYVNDFSYSLGRKGRGAVDALEQRAAALGLCA